MRRACVALLRIQILPPFFLVLWVSPYLRQNLYKQINPFHIQITNNVNKEFLPKSSSQVIPPPKKVPPKKFLPKKSSKKISLKKSSQKNPPKISPKNFKKVPKNSPQKIQSQKIPKILKISHSYIALSGQKPFRACFFNQSSHWKEILTTNCARYNCSGDDIKKTSTKAINTNCDGCADGSNCCSLTIWNLEIGICN